MPVRAAIQVINSPLAVIGFNAMFNDLADIDQVEASLYCGEPLVNSHLFTQSAHQLLASCIGLVIEANKLATNKIAVIVAGDEQESDFSDYHSCQTVPHVSDALFCAEQLIKAENVAVLIISASLPTEIINVGKATISFDAAFESYAQLQGVACLLLCSETFAEQHHSVCYGVINNVASGEHASEQKQIEAIIEQALDDATLTNNHKINTLEVSACINRQLNVLEQRALINSYNQVYETLGGDKTLTTALSCHKSVLGENAVLSELMAVIHALISLQQRYRPGIMHWQTPANDLLTQWKASPFYLFNQAVPVFPSCNGKATMNAISILTGCLYSHIVLSEPKSRSLHQNGFMNNGKQTLFIVGADTQSDLLNKLEQLMLAEKSEFKALAKQLYHANKQQSFTYKVVLIAQSVAELNKELQLSLTGVEQAFTTQGDWKTPKGSYFTSQPNPNAKTAFLYPGIGATYLGLGRDVFHLFPEIYPSVIALADDIGATLKDELLNPRSVVSLSFNELKRLDLQLRHSLANIAECGVGFACVFTKLFAQVFELQADFACGYSMGEVSMFAALGCWQNPAAMSARLANSNTFNHQLSGELRSVRKLWNLPESNGRDVTDGEFEQIWESYNIKGTLSQVTAAIKADERVYVTLINTPDSLVIAGFPADCLAVIKRLGVRAMALNIANAIHSEPAYQEYEQMLGLYTMPVTERINTKMLSSSCYLPIPQHSKAIAVSIAKCLCEPVDFPRLVNKLSDNEVQVFIEMGAGRSLCSWTDKILASQADNKHHISVPINAKGTDEQQTYSRAVAKLVSVGVAINIERFFSGSLIKQVSH